VDTVALVPVALRVGLLCAKERDAAGIVVPGARVTEAFALPKQIQRVPRNQSTSPNTATQDPKSAIYPAY